METEQKNFENFIPFPDKFPLKMFSQKLRLKISWGPLGVKSRIQSHLGVGNGEKHPLEQLLTTFTTHLRKNTLRQRDGEF